MPDYIVGNRTITLRPSDAIGKGTEADVYRTRRAAYKIFKSPTHPEVAVSPKLQKEARERIAMHQKKLPAFPRGLPKKVIAPRELIRDQSGLIVGYEMDFVENARELFFYGDPDVRAQGISDDTVRSIFIDLYKTVKALHSMKVVIGDFTDLNVMVQGSDAYLIDADSMQFGSFMAHMFTAAFVDPMNCDPKLTEPLLIRPHNPNTDWYAYLVMLMRSLLFVRPYDGTYTPKNRSLKVPHDARPLKRITVFDPEVIYPKSKKIRRYDILPDDLLELFKQTFKDDKRGIPPLSLIENLRFTTCTTCGTVHARSQCPHCVGITPPMVKEVHTGAVKGYKVFETFGPILYATMQQGTLRYVYHNNGAYLREGDQMVASAPLDPNIRFRVWGDKTLLARGEQCLVFQGGQSPITTSVDAYGLLPLIDANNDHMFFASGDGLYRAGTLGLDYREKIGDVLPHQTLFWVGDTLGFGFYRAAELSNFFVFRPQSRGLNDSVPLPGIRGQLVDATCVFGPEHVWFFTATQEGTAAVNRCFLLDSRGAFLASAEGRPGDGTWLGKIRGACAARDFLLVPTDDGVMRVARNGSTLGVVKEYPETHRFVDAGSQLFINNDGLHVVGRNDIWRVVIG